MHADRLADLVADGELGVSEAIGSCRIMAMRLPRTPAASPRRTVQKVLALEHHAALVIRAAAGKSRRMVRASVLLPEPDSPTMPSLAGVQAERDLVDGTHHARLLLET